MKLTKKQETEIWQVYNTWLHAYLNGDVVTYDKYLDKDYHFIGSTDNEEFLSKKDTTNFFEKTADQLAGKCDLRNETKIIEKFGKLIFITHLFDAWFKNGDDWAFYGRFRFTNALQKNKEGWRFIYQHFSTTDSKTDEGETIGFDKVNAENLELKDAIKRRTFELEEKNRELEVEGALDRIRAQAVAMKQTSDLLDIVVTMRNEFIKLGHEAHYFWHMMWLPEIYEKAMTSGDGTKIGFVMKLPRHIHGDIPLLAKWEKSKKQTVVYAMNVDEALDYVHKMVTLGDFQNIDPQAPTEDNIRHIGGLTFIMARTTHGEIGYSLPGIVKNPPKEDIDILVKFAGAFDLAHRRFLDLQNAEKQAREVEIELALEKVRSRSLAMHKSEELNEVVSVIFEKLKDLQISATAVGIGIYIDGSKDLNSYVCGENKDGLVITNYRLPYFNNKISREICNMQEKQLDFFVGHYTKAVKNSFYKYILEHTPEFKHLPEDIKSMIFNSPSYTITMVGVNHAIFNINDFEGNVLSNDDVNIIKRFAKVFDQTYTRFLDLQKAEAQARESEIELALERVRARTMAMQKSDELSETSSVLFEQFKALGEISEQISIGIFKEEKNAMELYSTLYGKQWKDVAILDLDEPMVMKKIHKAWKQKKKSLILDLEGNDLKKYNEYRNNLSKQRYKEHRWIIQVAFFSKGILTFSATEPHANETIELLERFAKVFEQTYTRFLDLQKAEAQAKEAQIEAALERVRSRSMAMHNSDELREAGALLFNEITKLGIESITSGYVILEEDEKIGWNYMPDPSTGQIIPIAIGVFHDKTDNMRSVIKNWKKQEPVFVIDMDEQQTIDHQTFIAEQSINFPISAEKLIAVSPAQLKLHNFNFKQGYLLIVGGEFLTDNQTEIMLRFTKVFQQTYTRFLDLQKAEAQAREVRIEMALEKVRSRTMAMQHSKELPEAANVLFTEVQNLGIPAWSCGYNILSEDKKSSTCIMSSEGEIQSPFILPLTKHKSLKPWHKAILKNTDFFVYEQGRKDLKEHYDYMQSLPDLKETFQQLKEANIPLPTFQVNHLAKFTNGFLLFITYERVPEAHDIFQRFAKVFEQTYTRFLDLEKAEAQTRTAQINLAVERVRAKALAMHKSEEIIEVVAKLKDEVMALDIPDVIAATIFLKEGEDKVRMWDLSSLDITDNNDYEVPFDITFIIKKTDPHLYMKRVWENTDDYFVEIQEGKDFKRLMEWLREHHKDDIAIEVEEFMQSTQLKRLYHAAKKLNNGKLVIDLLDPPSDEMETILTKMGAAFDLAYKRFEDLQKAEAQTREAQIEAALEKVRSRSLAMHNADELGEVVLVIVEKLTELGVILDANGITLCTYFPDSKDVLHWIASPDFSHVGEYLLPYFDHVILNEAWQSKDQGDTYFSKAYAVKDKNSFFEHAFVHSDYKQLPEEFKQWIFQNDKHILSFAWQKNSALLIPSNTGVLPTEDEKEILIRFSKVFEQAYIRFMDLQKAEAQAREAKIEVALERVRARAMAMHQTDELTDVLCVLFDQFDFLGINPVLTHLTLMDEENETFSLRITTTAENRIVAEQFIDINAVDAWKDSFANWKKSEPNAIDCIDYPPEALPMVWEVLGEVMDALPKGHKIYPKDFPDGLYTTQGHFKFGYIGFNHKRRATDEEKSIVVRFAKEFGRTYQRFLDLQKAEAQAKEAQIEAALERVRSRSMAMHKSDEMQLVADTIYEQLNELGFEMHAVGMSGAMNPKKGYEVWAGGVGFEKPLKIPYSEATKVQRDYNEVLIKRIELFSKTYSGKTKKEYIDFLLSSNKFPSFLEKLMVESKAFSTTLVTTKNSGIQILRYTAEPYSEEENAILIRFAKVFEQAYIRFMDLQKAEAQAREAQIEAALERVRSRSMAMHKSDEMLEVIEVVAKQLLQLNLKFDTISFSKNNQKGEFKFWTASKGQPKPLLFQVPFLNTRMLNSVQEAQKKGVNFIEDVFTALENKEWSQHLIKFSELKYLPQLAKDFMLNAPGFARSSFLLKSIDLYVGNFRAIPFTKEENAIFSRFAHVFEQAYTRFLDLQKSEKQARESLIEASLERVRSRTLAMQNSEELAETSVVVFQQLLELGIAPNRLFIGIIKDEGHKIDAWATNEDGSKLASHFVMQASENKSIKKMLDGWKQKKKSLIIDLKGKELQEYFQYLNKDMEIPFIHGLEQKRRVQTIAYFSGGLIGMAAPEEQPQETIDLLERFAAVFNLTYTRFNDLKVAEAQAREAKIEGALERVRARALAMQEPEELKDVAKVLRHEMGLLDIEELETCSIYINQEATNKTECWYALKDIRSKKQKLINDHFELNLKDTWVGREMQKFYKSKNKEVSIVMTGNNRKEWIDYCEKHSKPFKGYYGEEIPDRTYHLYKFSHGAIGVATSGDISDENWNLIKRTASVFSLAYSRFKDLTQARLDLAKLKEEKQRAEDALSELQTTQTQLIQSEKMASLGELTAGIAHEIQNPLNFVNNFSEVSKELLDEMLEEMENGDLEEVRAIMDDVIQNLEKINHHGKRADGIVKGMLQHSRKSSDTKEPTNINVLADEYLRLAYHGLRAKDKSFNATLVTDFDDTIGSINVLPQDIGRVVLNLLTNAFYVVNEKKQSNQNGYEPTVSLTTKKDGNWVTISVKDNGNGIPKHVLEKIFQPFFTTKPTGQGTGLGLSMSYDIVTKGHGGELKVDTKHGEGTEFSIILPIKSN